MNLAKKGRGLVRMKALWAFSKYVVTRNLWKGLVVPGVTYGNAVITFNTGVEKKFDQIQREVIRFSLGCRFTCAREFLEGEGGMSTFREREAKSKLLYWLRLSRLDESRWAAKVQAFKARYKLRTKWDRRVEFHARFIGYKKRDWAVAALGGSEIKKLVKQKFEERWAKSLEKRTSLVLYRAHKLIRGHVDRLYDNSRGSGLFASARAGMLDTQMHRKHYMEVDGLCRLCGEEEESIEHVVINCSKLGVRVAVGLDVALGFSLRRIFSEIKTTKKRLSEWEAQIQ